jgi:hypothetical protein
VSGVVDLGQAAVWHRQVAALAAAADRAGVAAEELPAVRARLLAQQARFAETPSPPTPLIPTPTEIAAAGPALGDLSPTSVSAALRTASSTLDAVDAVLVEHLRPRPMAMPPPPMADGGWPAGVRNGLVYGGYALCVAVAQFALLVASDDERSLPITAPLCLLVLPAFGFLAGWVTIGTVFGRRGGPAVKRSPKLGALISFAPDLGLCAWVGLIYAIGHA